MFKWVLCVCVCVKWLGVCEEVIACWIWMSKGVWNMYV